MQRRHALATLAASVFTPTAFAQGEWPTAKPMTLVVPFTPGGSADVTARTLAEKLSHALKQSVVVENRPGTGGGIAASMVAKAQADGYTLMLGVTSTHAINVSLYRSLPYDPVKDFEPVSLVSFVPGVLLVDPNAGVNNVQELVALLKRDPKRRTFASAGAGTSVHLSGELFSELINVPLTHVPYKGAVPAMLDVSAGEVTFMFDQMTPALPMLQAGKLKLLAVTTARRIALSPGTPTMIEAGVSGFDISSWQAIYAPKGTPRPVVQRLSQEITRALRQPDVQDKLGKGMGMEIVAGGPDELAALMAREIPRWAALVKKSGAKAD
jgi:tripartite-type tricarboxylate transporter receptor subunit TctC